MEAPLSALQPIGEWRPDIDGPFVEWCRVALNAIPRGEDYISVESVVEDTIAALPTACRGACAVKDRSGNVSIFAGTKTKLYKLNGVAWDDVTRGSGGDYNVPDEGRWVFALYGERLIAADYADDTQYFDIGTGGSTDFAALPNAPKCREMAVVNNFVLMGNTFDSVDDARPNRIRWSGLDDTESWAVSATTQSDFQDLENGFGAVKAVAGYESYAIVMQESGILRATYVGSPQIFDIQVAEGNQGPIGGNTVIIVGPRIFYRAEAGFFMFNGVNSEPIGNDKVDEWFNTNVRTGTYAKITTSYNAKRKIAAWAVVTNAATTDYPDYVLIYNWVYQKWGLIQQGVEMSFTSLSSGKTVEDLEALYGDLEDIPYSLDNPLWAGGNTLPAIFTTNHKLAYYNGDPMQATFELAEARLNENGRAFVSSVLPITDATAVEVYGITRQTQAATESTSAAFTYEARTGEYNCRLDAMFHRAKLVLSNWSYLRGIQFRARNSGK